VVLVGLSGCGSVLGPRATLGPGSIVRGRGLYNEVISETNNEQTLELIVRARYGEPLGLLSVSSVTANLRTTATGEAQFGIGPSSNYKGNLTPLSVGVAYEENPTISYAPVQGERYAKGILSPIGLDMLVLLLGVEHSPGHLLSVVIKQVNGLPNPTDGDPARAAPFREAIALLSDLEEGGQATWTSTGAEGFALVLHDYLPAQRRAVSDLLHRLGLPESLAHGGRQIVLPVRLAFGPATKPELHVQTRSVYDLIEIAAGCVAVPAEHAAAGIADPAPATAGPLREHFAIRSSRARPSEDTLVAVRHRGYWFYIAANDGPSKFVFRLLQTLIGMRLVEATPQTMPALTIPVGK
jgi:hypothetical protein